MDRGEGHLEPSRKDQAPLDDPVARARAGDREAWGELYGRHAPAIFRFCRRVLPTREDAEDATTEIFMKLPKKLGQYDPLRPFGSWLYKVAANHCWDLLRRRHIREDLETGDVERLPLEATGPDQLSRLMAAHTSAQVREALAKLPARSRMALALRYFSEMSYEEIADAMGLRRNVVGVVLLRARHQFRAALTGLERAAASSGGLP